MSKKGKGRFRIVERQTVETLEGAIEALGDQGNRIEAWRRVAERVLTDAGLPVALKLYKVGGEWSEAKPETKQRPVSIRLITKHVELEGWPPGAPESLAASILVEARNMFESAGTTREIDHAFRLGELAGLLRAAMLDRKGARKAPRDRFNIWPAFMDMMQSEMPGATFNEIWDAIGDRTIEIDEHEGHEVYRDGCKLVHSESRIKENDKGEPCSEKTIARHISKDSLRVKYFRKE